MSKLDRVMWCIVLTAIACVLGLVGLAIDDVTNECVMASPRQVIKGSISTSGGFLAGSVVEYSNGYAGTRKRNSMFAGKGDACIVWVRVTEREYESVWLKDDK